MPVSDAMVAEWKADALAGGTQTGNVTIGSSGGSLGPKKIVGNLTVNGGGTLTITGTIWVTGTITVSNGGKMKLINTYSYNSGVVLSDSYISLTGGGAFSGSGQVGSFPMLLSTSDCPVSSFCGSNPAIYVSNGAGTVVLYAQNGTVNVSGGSSVKEITGKTVSVTNGGNVIYDTGLASQSFSSGPSGGYHTASFSETQ
jgi:hypothetical protein